MAGNNAVAQKHSDNNVIVRFTKNKRKTDFII